MGLLALIALGVPAGATPFTGSFSMWGNPIAGLAGDSTSTTTPNAVTVPAGATTAGLPTTITLVTTPTPGGTYGYNLKIANKPLGPLGAGSFSGTPLAGPMAIQGAILATLTNFNNFTIANLPLTSAGTKGVGLGGTLSVTSYAGGIWSVAGAPWTTGPAAVNNVNTPGGSVLPTLTLTGYDNRNAAGLGMVQLVTPIQFNLGGGSSVGTHGVLTLNFVPEPGTMLLVGTGLAAIAYLSRRRR
jgi:hypothetical protein